jgi:hypothetical protein
VFLGLLIGRANNAGQPAASAEQITVRTGYIWGGDRFRCELSKNTNITNVPLLRALTVA